MRDLLARLLGDAQVLDGGAPVVFRSRKALALVLYLMHGGTARSRRDVARLFWGSGNDEAARTSLRTALQRLPATVAPLLEAGRDQIALRGTVELDCLRFGTLAQSDDVARLAEAAQLYRGEFWPGAHDDATPEFDDWVQRQRTHYRQLAHAVFERLIGAHRERARLDSSRAAIEREAAFATARRWVAMEPAAEAAHRLLMQLFVDSGQRDAALAQYEVCRREIAVAFGRAPSPETQALHAGLAAGVAPPGGTSGPPTQRTDTPPGTAPAALTSFVGRVEELAAIEGLFADPNCRLVTLQGLGGIGKSRLAQVLMQQLGGRHSLGATWVALEGVTTGEQLPHVIARALGIELADARVPLEALCRALQAQDRLLVLDNFEQLVAAGAAVDCVLALLAAAPRLRLLITSREVLGLQEEWIYEVPGLDYPAPDAPIAGHAAVELFAQRARQAYYGFSATAEAPHIARICRLVEGLPLALELAAAWVRTVPCGDLAAAIEKEINGLASRHRNRPARQQGLDAVVLTSWQMLSAEQQRVFAPLGLFETTFTQQSALAVTDGSMRVLSALVDKSLLQRRADGRLGLHAVVCGFLRARLAGQAGALREAQRHFAANAAAILRRCAGALDGPGEIEARAELLLELPNLRAAGSFWLDEPRIKGEAALVELLAPLLRVLAVAELHGPAVEMAEQALARDLVPAARAALLTRRARSLAAIGVVDESYRTIDQAVELAQSLPPTQAARVLIDAVGMELTRDRRGNTAGRLQALQALLPQVDDPAVLLHARIQQAMFTFNRGALHDAVIELRAALALARAAGIPSHTGTVADVLAAALLLTGNADEAEPLLREAVVLHERCASPGNLGRSLNTLAYAMMSRRVGADLEGAHRVASRALDIFERIGHPMAAPAADTLGCALLALGRHDAAVAAFERARVLAGGAINLQAEPVYHLALLELDRGNATAALEHGLRLLDFALQTDTPFVRRLAAVVAAELEAARDPASATARAWLQYLLADRDLGDEPRRRGEALLAKLVTRGAVAGPLAGSLLALVEAARATLSAGDA